jgi:hypothetical protein
VQNLSIGTLPAGLSESLVDIERIEARGWISEVIEASLADQYSISASGQNVGQVLPSHEASSQSSIPLRR